MQPNSQFAVRPEMYDALIDWERRLKNERPFFQQILREAHCETVLDAACGTGHHAAMFRGWGRRVEGADADAQMIAACRRLHGEDETLRWSIRPFSESARDGRMFDLTVCLGNSLALAGERSDVEGGLRALLDATRPGGQCVIQVLNLWKLPDGPSTWQKLVPFDEPGKLLLKGIHRADGWGHIDFVELDLTGATPAFRSSGERFRGIDAEELTAIATPYCDYIRIFGDYLRSPYERESSADLIAVLRRKDAG